MADTKTTEKAKTEDTKNAEINEAKVYKLLKNVKYGDKPYKIGEKIEIADKDLEEFKKAGAIFIENDEKSEEK